MAEISVNAYNIHKMCRLCLSSDVSLLNIFQSSTKKKSAIANLIMKCAPVQIKRSDEMPNFICQLCYAKLEKSHQFQTQIVKSDKTLRRYFRKLRTSDKQCSENLSIHDTNADISVQSLSTESAIDTLETHSNNEGCAISGEDTKNDFDDTKLFEHTDVNWKEKESLNNYPKNKDDEAIFSFGAKKELLVYDNSPISSECADGTMETLSRSCGSEISCEDPKIDVDRTIRNFERPCSADITEDIDKRAEGAENNQIHKKSSKVKYKCDFCDQCFLYPSCLFRHRRSHTGVKPYECDVCNKCFTQANTLKIHKRLHYGEKPYQCLVCNKHFTQLSNLIHHKRIHTGEKRDDINEDSKKPKPGSVSTNDEACNNESKIEYKCDSCNKCLTDLLRLNKHKLLHQKSYRCGICDKLFSKQTKLRRHKLTHTGEKPYMCELCSNCFTNADHLKIHKRIHTGEKPYRCEVCNRQFAYLHGLTRHKRTHTGEKPYRCDICDRQFVQSTHLRNHKRTHTGEKPYQCDVCNKRFSSSGCVTTHKRTHTGGRPNQCHVTGFV